MHHLNWPQVGIVYLFLTVWLLCTGFIKNIVARYNINDLCVYGCFVDASKAFDRVNHSIPFDRLLKRDLSPVIRYSDQNVCVSWIVRFLTNEDFKWVASGWLIVDTDASDTGIWAMLSQVQTWKVCMHACMAYNIQHKHSFIDWIYDIWTRSQNLMEWETTKIWWPYNTLVSCSASFNTGTRVLKEAGHKTNNTLPNSRMDSWIMDHSSPVKPSKNFPTTMGYK